MSFTVLIPARLASSRLPDKPLADIAGKPMVVHVAERAARSGAGAVVVAADDARTVAACAAHGVRAILTRVDHATGSDRLAEACGQLGLDGDAMVVNVQGDEPLIDPLWIEAAAEDMARDAALPMATLSLPIRSLPPSPAYSPTGTVVALGPPSAPTSILNILSIDVLLSLPGNSLKDSVV